MEIETETASFNVGRGGICLRLAVIGYFVQVACLNFKHVLYVGFFLCVLSRHRTSGHQHNYQ